MKKIIFIFAVLLGAVFIKIPEYVELNDLAIASAIGILPLETLRQDFAQRENSTL